MGAGADCRHLSTVFRSDQPRVRPESLRPVGCRPSAYLILGLVGRQRAGVLEKEFATRSLVAAERRCQGAKKAGLTEMPTPQHGGEKAIEGQQRAVSLCKLTLIWGECPGAGFSQICPLIDWERAVRGEVVRAVPVVGLACAGLASVMRRGQVVYSEFSLT